MYNFIVLRHVYTYETITSNQDNTHLHNHTQSLPTPFVIHPSNSPVLSLLLPSNL